MLANLAMMDYLPIMARLSSTARKREYDGLACAWETRCSWLLESSRSGPNRWRTLAPRRADQILAWGWPRDIGIILTALAMTDVGDMLVVLAAKGSTKRAFGMHGLTAVFMVLAGILLAVGAP